MLAKAACLKVGKLVEQLQGLSGCHNQLPILQANFYSKYYRRNWMKVRQTAVGTTYKRYTCTTVVLYKYMRGIYLCALCESLLDRIIKLRTNFNCAKLKFAPSTLAID